MTTPPPHTLARLLGAEFAPRHTNVPIELPRSEPHWESLIALASAEAVLPGLHQSVKESTLTPHLPPEVADCFSAVAELNRERNAELFSQLREITAALNLAGIEPLALKGLAYILTGTYKDSGARYLSDIDLLIPSNQLEDATEAFERLGYRPDENDPIASFRHHLPTLYRPGGFPVELHRSVGLGVCRKLLPTSELLRDSSALSWHGVRLRIPSPDHLVTHLVIHSQLLHPYVERIWPPLRALYDLALLEHRFAAVIHWPSIEKRFRSQRQYPTLALHLLQAQRSLGTPLPIDVSLNWPTRLRWARRQLLRRYPKLRFLDPFFLWSSAVSRRARVVKFMLLSGGWRQVFQRLFEAGFYRRLASETEVR